MKLRFPSFAIVFILVMAAAWFVVTLSRRHHASVVPLATPSFAPLATPSVAPQRQPQESLAPSATHAQTEAQPMPNPKPIAPEVLKAGGLELPVVFPDGTTPQKLTLISDDPTRCGSQSAI